MLWKFEENSYSLSPLFHANHYQFQALFHLHFKVNPIFKKSERMRGQRVFRASAPSVNDLELTQLHLCHLSSYLDFVYLER